MLADGNTTNARRGKLLDPLPSSTAADFDCASLDRNRRDIPSNDCAGGIRIGHILPTYSTAVTSSIRISQVGAGPVESRRAIREQALSIAPLAPRDFCGYSIHMTTTNTTVSTLTASDSRIYLEHFGCPITSANATVTTFDAARLSGLCSIGEIAVLVEAARYLEGHSASHGILARAASICERARQKVLYI